MQPDKELREQILELIPQQAPFRFVDEILEVDGDRIVGTYRFKEDEFFYPGHFPGASITPGVILIETMAQTGAVGHGIYLMMQKGMSLDEIKSQVTVFSLADQVEFFIMVPPGTRVIVTGEKMFYRRGALRSSVAMAAEDGKPICRGILTGTGVRLNG
ncbi:3-hydroxyacyl-ACP dehydratase FabZ family protein [Desulfatibacillum aliphaticivorans]|uniref:3-hydroxyacyl-ACP dehydratase FabZ family protein n=1 Tax=Desulfatibacillum aliphaticivorans TaxID=218208 RepID=UPI0004158717|nr:hydroxymyristoyl-ACP dehydratase [Desulfatibacillum aliphaticivorans]